MTIAYLLLGTNLGDKKENLEACIKLLTEKDVMVVSKSSIYETEAWGFEDQPSFYNQAIKVLINYSPEDLLITVKQVEKEMGRINNERWHQRLIDIDILYYSDEVIQKENLVIPHPELANRRFALEPLCNIADQLLHPIANKTNEQLLQECQDKLKVKQVE